MPIGTRGRGRSFRGRPSFRGRGRGRHALNGGQNETFRNNRLIEEEQQPSVVEVPSSNDDDSAQSDVESNQSGSDGEAQAQHQSYMNLLQSLKTGRDEAEPLRKRLKLDKKDPNFPAQAQTQRNGGKSEDQDDGEVINADAGLLEAVEDADQEARSGHESEDDDENDDSHMIDDPFEKQYVRMDEQVLNEAIEAVKQKKRQIEQTKLSAGLCKQTIRLKDVKSCNKSNYAQASRHLKRRLAKAGASILNSLSGEEKDIVTEVFSYKDIQSATRTTQNTSRLRDMVCLHSMNHILKTRDRILKNNTKASQADDEGSIDLRDQGFTRPKVLVIVPTKQACSRFVDSIVRISEPDQQENKSRFTENFTGEDDEAWENKPDDFRELFGGNHEEDFRVGLKFTRKTIKYFSGFYNSDIIFASALGLMRTITTGGGVRTTTDRKKKAEFDADFLSSIEVVLVDHASAIQMQNWQHLEYVFSNLNLLPKDSHGCDFSRVREWYLNGHAKYLRQTIVLSSYHTPEINSLFTNYTFNIAGSVKYTPTYTGAMLALPPTMISFTPSQSFLRFASTGPSTDSDARFTYFTATVLPQLIRSRSTGVLIFIPTYADFARLRNHFSTSAFTASLSFGSVSEYSPVKDVSRARSHFMNGRHSLLIYSERAHHHFRYRIRGVKRVVFYGLPENPTFWGEIVGLLELGGGQPNRKDGDNREDEEVQKRGKGAVRAMFSKWDVMKLERIVGTERVGRLVGDKGGDVFEFV